MNSPCELQAVLVSSDSAVLKAIVPCLEDMGIAPFVCAQPSSALQTLTRQKIDAFFVDRELDPELSVLRGMRTSPSSRAAVAFAIVPEQTPAGEATRLADFVIDKPLASTNVSRALRAAYGIMLKERRRYFRHSVRIQVDLTDSTYRKFLGHTINVSQTGIAVECAAPLATRDTVQLEFRLPGSDDKLNCKAQIIWTAEQGKVGLTFTQMKSSHKELLTGWMENEFHRLWHMPPAKPPVGSNAVLAH